MEFDWKIVAVISGLLVNLFGLGIFLWRVSRWVTQRDEAIIRSARVGSTNAIANKDNIDDIKALTKSLARYAKETSQSIAKLEQMAIQREKGQDRLEGHMDGCRRSVMEQTSKLSTVIGSLEALWITLQTIFPDKIPKRASDRG